MKTKLISLLRNAIIAIYPLLSFSQTQIGQDIIGAVSYSEFGASVDISTNGSYIIIGAPSNGATTKVFSFINNTWTQIGQDITLDSGDFACGKSVSISDDGSIIAVGSFYKVKIFNYSNGNWVQMGSSLTSSQLNKISLSSNGLSLAMLSYNAPTETFVKVFTFNNNNWVQVGQDIYAGYVQDAAYGHCISLSPDATTLAIGSPDADNGYYRGKLQVYRNINETWTQLGQDIDGNSDYGSFAGSLSLSYDGNRIIAGSFFSDTNGTNSGDVKVYQFNGSTWNQLGQTLFGETAGDNFGTGVSISNNGNLIAIGVPNYNTTTSPTQQSGYIRIYEYYDNGLFQSWLQVGSDIIGNLSDQFGISVALSPEGSKLIGGAFTASPNMSSGLARVYDLDTLLSSDEFVLSKVNLYPNPAKDQFSIQLKEGLHLKKVNIYNNLGQLIQTTIRDNIEIVNFTTGLYFVEIITDKGKTTKQLVIE